MSDDPWRLTGKRAPARIQISTSVMRTMNLGDHGARVRYPVETKPEETVEQLVRRVFADIDSPYRTHESAEVIEIQALVLPDAEEET